MQRMFHVGNLSIETAGEASLPPDVEVNTTTRKY